MLFADLVDGYTAAMWIVLVAAVLVVLLVAWRVFLLLQHRANSSRPIDSGHPHLTDVDPHDAP